MTPIFRKPLLALLLAGMIFAAPAFAKTNVVIVPKPGETKAVVIQKGNTTLRIYTTPDAAERIRKMIKRSDRVIIHLPSQDGHYPGYTYYPENYYPYFKDKGPSYSVGYALGRKLSD